MSLNPLLLIYFQINFVFVIGDEEEPMDIDIDFEIDPSSGEDPFKPQMPPLTPAEIKIQPSFVQQSSPVQPPKPLEGRLLTPEEGCGSVAVSNKRIVGGSPAKNGMYESFCRSTSSISITILLLQSQN